MITDYQTHLSRVSKNSKVGPIPVSTTTAKTCPLDCPFNHANNGGCYAETGPLSWHWSKVTKETRGTSFIKFLDKIKTLPRGQLWRHNQAGDLPGDGQQLDGDACEKLTAANKNKRGFTYTHYKPETNGNGIIIKAMNAAGFVVNLSGNSMDHAIKLSKTAAGPVVAVTEETKRGAFKYKNKSFVQCPATRIKPGTENNKKPEPLTNCARCQLCAVPDRKSIVYFPAHGVQVKKVNNYIKEAKK